MDPHPFIKEKCLSLQSFKALTQHSAPTLKRLQTAFPKSHRSQRHRSLTWETPLDHCCTSVPFRVSAFLINIQCWKQLKSLPDSVLSLLVTLGLFFFFPSDFILLKGKLSVSFYHEKQSIKLISSYHSSYQSHLSGGKSCLGKYAGRSKNPWFPTSDPRMLHTADCGTQLPCSDRDDGSIPEQETI